MSVFASLSHRLSATAERVGLSLVLFAVVLMLVMVGCGAALAALWLWFSTLLPPPQAALATAAVAFALAGVMALAARAVLRPRRRVRYSPYAAGAPLSSASAASAASALGSELGTAGGEWVKGNLTGVLVGALATGFVLGFSPRLREALLRKLT